MTYDELMELTSRSLNRLCKWRTVYAGWQLGTRAKGDPECAAVSDMQERGILLRCEMNALVALLIDRGVFTKEDWFQKMIIEADALSALYEEKFPGFKATDTGMNVDVARAAKTMKGWKL